MKTIKTLHLASFNGNVGDNANHSGFYSQLSRNLFYKFDINQLEIREFYWKQRNFDHSFVELANSYDLLIIGGGNYFELWVDHSPTGTSIMIEPSLFKKIKIPVLFNALGVDPAQGATESNCDKFRIFLELLLSSEKYFVSVRNDGSLEAVSNFIGKEFCSKIVWTPDAGIFVEINDDFNLINTDKNYVAINIAGDMIEKRFPGNGNYIDFKNFKSIFRELIINILRNDITDEILFVPHIHSDTELIIQILKKIPDPLKRCRISIAPLIHGQGSEKNIFALYKKAKFSLSMRFHSNVCSVGLEKPTIAMSNYRQIQKLCEEMNLLDYLVEVNRKNFDIILLEKIKKILCNYDTTLLNFKNISYANKKLYNNYISDVLIWLNKHF